MITLTGVYISVFWVMQVIAQLFFKWGSAAPERWLWGFFGGNLFGFTSIWLLMLLYKTVHPNVALGIGAGGAFLLSQVFLAYIFKASVAPVQWFGIAAIMVGMAALALGRA